MKSRSWRERENVNRRSNWNSCSPVTPSCQHTSVTDPFLHLVWKCVLVIQTQVDSHDISLFPPVFVMCPTDHLCSGFITAYVTSTGRSKGSFFFEPKATTHPVLITCFPVSSLSGTHQAALAFTLQKIFSQMYPRPPLQVVWVIGYQCVLVVLCSYIWHHPVVIWSPNTHFKTKCKQEHRLPKRAVLWTTIDYRKVQSGTQRKRMNLGHCLADTTHESNIKSTIW